MKYLAFLFVLFLALVGRVLFANFEDLWEDDPYDVEPDPWEKVTT